MLENKMGVVLIIVVCAAVVLAGAMRKKLEWLLNLVMRSIVVAIAIYFINGALEMQGISLGIGINPITILTSGILGIPGLLALYGLGIYRLL